MSVGFLWSFLIIGKFYAYFCISNFDSFRISFFCCCAVISVQAFQVWCFKMLKRALLFPCSWNISMPMGNTYYCILYIHTQNQALIFVLVWQFSNTLIMTQARQVFSDCFKVSKQCECFNSYWISLYMKI